MLNTSLTQVETAIFHNEIGKQEFLNFTIHNTDIIKEIAHEAF